MSNALEQAKTPQELRREREQRITDAISLKMTDRVPVVCEIGYFAAKYAGIPCSAAYYDFDSWLAALGLLFLPAALFFAASWSRSSSRKGRVCWRPY